MSNHGEVEELSEQEERERDLHTMYRDLRSAEVILDRYVYRLENRSARLRSDDLRWPVESVEYLREKVEKWSNEVEECRRLLRELTAEEINDE